MTWWNQDDCEPWPTPPPPPPKGKEAPPGDGPSGPPPPGPPPTGSGEDGSNSEDNKPDPEDDDLEKEDEFEKKDREKWEKIKEKLKQSQGDDLEDKDEDDAISKGRKPEIQGTQQSQQISTKYKPKLPWQKIIKSFVSGATVVDLSYTKPAKRNAGAPDELDMTGSSVVRPGYKELDPIYKMCFVVDTSGSMYGVVDKALIEVQKLLSVLAKDAEPRFGLVFFTESAYYYSCNLQKGEAVRVNSFDELANPPKNAAKLNLKDVLNSQYSGGTVFTRSMADQLKKLLKKDYNVCMFTDEGILENWGKDNNWLNFLSVYTTAGKHLYLILKNNDNFNDLVKQMDVDPQKMPENITHL